MTAYLSVFIIFQNESTFSKIHTQKNQESLKEKEKYQGGDEEANNTEHKKDGVKYADYATIPEDSGSLQEQLSSSMTAAEVKKQKKTLQISMSSQPRNEIKSCLDVRMSQRSILTLENPGWG